MKLTTLDPEMLEDMLEQLDPADLFEIFLRDITRGGELGAIVKAATTIQDAMTDEEE